MPSLRGLASELISKGVASSLVIEADDHYPHDQTTTAAINSPEDILKHNQNQSGGSITTTTAATTDFNQDNNSSKLQGIIAPAAAAPPDCPGGQSLEMERQSETTTSTNYHTKQDPIIPIESVLTLTLTRS
jgi:hypothetical protein